MLNELKAAALKHPAGIYSLPLLVLNHFLSQRGISQISLHHHLREKALKNSYEDHRHTAGYTGYTHTHTLESGENAAVLQHF